MPQGPGVGLRAGAEGAEHSPGHAAPRTEGPSGTGLRRPGGPGSLAVPPPGPASLGLQPCFVAVSPQNAP